MIFLRSQKPQVHDCTHTILSRNHSIYSLDVGTTVSNAGRDGSEKQTIGLTEHREEVLQLLRSISKSPTEDSYHDEVTTLKTSKVWQSSPQLRNCWFEKTWMPQKPRYSGTMIRVIINQLTI